MNFFEIVLTLAISLGAVVWGVNIYNQKGTWFLAGWNTMSKEEKATYNEKAICHLFGKCVVFCGIGAFLLLYGSFNHNDFGFVCWTWDNCNNGYSYNYNT